MNKTQIAGILAALPPGVGPSALRAVADAWDADPTLSTKVLDGDYTAVVDAVVDKSPAIVKTLLHILLPRLTA